VGHLAALGDVYIQAGYLNKLPLVEGFALLLGSLEAAL
jgi:hypothetical protein